METFIWIITAIGLGAGLAMDAAAKILSDNTDDSRNKSLYDEFLEKAGDAHDSENH